MCSVLAVLGGAGYWLYRDVTAPRPADGGAHGRDPAAHAASPKSPRCWRSRGSSGIRGPSSCGATLSGRSSALLAGEYEFPAGASPLQAMDIIAGGKDCQAPADDPGRPDQRGNLGAWCGPRRRSTGMPARRPPKAS